MTKQEFLEILRDYLEDHFSQYELNDIIRDYEEYFLNGEIEGKTEEEMMQGLGSPKSIAKALIKEVKDEVGGGTGKRQKRYRDTAIYATLKNMTATTKAKMIPLGAKIKAFIKRVGGKMKEVLNLTGEKMQKRLPDKMQKRIPKKMRFNFGHVSFNWLKRLFYICFTAMLLIPAGFIVVGMLFALGFLLFQTIGLIVAVPASFIVGQIHSAFLFFGLSVSLLGLGVLLFEWLLYIGVYRLLKFIVVQYISWLKTRFMYLRVATKRQLLPDLTLQGGESYEV